VPASPSPAASYSLQRISLCTTTRCSAQLEITDTGEQAVLGLVNGSLNHSLGRRVDNPDATIKLTKEEFAAIFLGEKTPTEVAGAGQLEATPDTSALDSLLGLLDEFNMWFNIIEP
jgi:alkyl sulfatase BDS1-like metallo-beta-lactamase superfamily hydrolase